LLREEWNRPIRVADRQGAKKENRRWKQQTPSAGIIRDRTGEHGAQRG
jgi:hypothetical protein